MQPVESPSRGGKTALTELMAQADARATATDTLQTPAGVPLKLSDINASGKVRAVITRRGRFLPEVRKALEAQGHEVAPMPCNHCTGTNRATRRACRECRDGLIEQAF